MDDLPLDPRIRDWVLLPFFAVMVLQGIFRHYVSSWMKDAPVPKLGTVETLQTMKRSADLRNNCHYLPYSAFTMRKHYLTHKVFAAVLNERGEESGGDADDALSALAGGGGGQAQQDPLAMVGMMKQNMSMMLPNMLLMGWASFFFSGFVVLKIPFALTNRFKSMLQRGIALESLDVSYVSSLSFYFVCFMGLKGLYSLLLGSENAADNSARIMKQQMEGNFSGNAMQVPDAAKLFEKEKTELEIARHVYEVGRAERRLLAMPGVARAAF